MLQFQSPSEFPVVYTKFEAIFDDGNRSIFGVFRVDAVFTQRHDFECISQSYEFDILLVKRLFALYELMKGW